MVLLYYHGFILQTLPLVVVDRFYGLSSRVLVQLVLEGDHRTEFSRRQIALNIAYKYCHTLCRLGRTLAKQTSKYLYLSNNKRFCENWDARRNVLLLYEETQDRWGVHCQLLLLLFIDKLII